MGELVEKAKLGDKGAFTELILLIKSDLYKIAKARLKDDEDVYDVIQETMLIAYCSIKKLKQIDSFKHWIIKILINRSNSLYKKRKRNKILSFDNIENYNLETKSNFDDIETLLDFNYICKNLKYEDRIIILLYYAEKFTDKEIGQILNLKENTVKTKRTRIKKNIKNMLKGGEKIYG